MLCWKESTYRARGEENQIEQDQEQDLDKCISNSIILPHKGCKWIEFKPPAYKTFLIGKKTYIITSKERP